MSIERILLIKGGVHKLGVSILPTDVQNDEFFGFDVDRQRFSNANHTYPIIINFWDSSEYIEQHNLVVSVRPCRF